MNSDPATLDRRARKKLETRRAIRDAALTLFEQYGYTKVTVEDITNAADMSPVTFYRHFGVKESVVISVALTPELDTTISTVLRTKDSTAIAQAISSYFNDADTWAPRLWRRLALINTTPELQALLWQRSTDWVATIVQDLPDTFETTLYARCIMSAIIESALRWARQHVATDTAALQSLTTQAITLLNEGFKTATRR